MLNKKEYTNLNKTPHLILNVTIHSQITQTNPCFLNLKEITLRYDQQRND